MNDDNLDMEVETVTLTDEKTGRTLDCTIEQSIEIEGDEYVLLLPVDSPVEIFAWQGDEEDEEAVPIDDDSEIERLFSVAKAVLEEQNLTLKRSAVTLTVEGELPDFDEEEEFLGDGSDEDQEELQLLTSFFHEDQEFSIYAPLDPFFILARMDDNDKPHLLSPEELERIEPMLPMIEEQLLDQFE